MLDPKDQPDVDHDNNEYDSFHGETNQKSMTMTLGTTNFIPMLI